MNMTIADAGAIINISWHATEDERRMLATHKLIAGDLWPVVDDDAFLDALRAARIASAEDLFPRDTATGAYVAAGYDREDVEQWDRDVFWDVVQVFDAGE